MWVWHAEGPKHTNLAALVVATALMVLVVALFVRYYDRLGDPTKIVVGSFTESRTVLTNDTAARVDTSSTVVSATVVLMVALTALAVVAARKARY